LDYYFIAGGDNTLIYTTTQTNPAAPLKSNLEVGTQLIGHIKHGSKC